MTKQKQEKKRSPADQDVRDRLEKESTVSFTVGAGAGSGKTSVLVSRVLGLVDSGVDLEDIVAITFTDKAAAELRERVRDSLAGEGGSAGDEVAKRRSEALGKVEISHLTTIHGFCRFILSSRPLEAGIAPGFRVLDGLESGLLLEEVVRDEIRRLQESDDSSLEGALLAGGRLSELRDLVAAVRRYPDLGVALPGPGEEDVADVLAALAEVAGRIAGFADVVTAGDTLMRQALEALPSVASVSGGGSDLHDRAAILRGISVGTNVGNRGRWKGAEEAFTELKEAWGELRKRKDAAIEGYESEQLAGLVEIAQAIGEEYRQRKAGMGALDFDDLLLKTKGLLESDPDVAGQIKEGFSHILVDEFQDTDPIQARIIERLSEAPDDRAERPEDAVPAPGRLFLVGDANQSIYRFRRADLAVFAQARAGLLKRGEEATLSVNFRSTPALVDTANRIFPGLLEGGEYTPLSAHRRDGGEGPAVSLLDIDPFLEEVVGVSGEKPRSVHVRTAEARALAGWINDRAGSGEMVFDRDSEKWRPLELRDIAILIRTYTGISVFERELERHGIPYRLSGGKSFFQRIEVLQTVPVLRAIADPGDEIAVVTALRSPFFGISDESLVRWSVAGRVFTYIDGDGDAAGESGDEAGLDASDDPPLVHARTVLRELHREASYLPPSALLRRLYERTRAVPLHALKPDGDRRMANLLKLLDLAAAYEEAAAGLTDAGLSEVGTLQGLVRYLEEQRRAAVEEESALVDEEGNAVTLMTIHSAKGLEFPVVAILDRSYAPRFLDRAIPDRAGGKTIVRGGRLKPVGWAEYEEREAAAQAEESRRLMYVAFTRARDHVVLCGQRSEEGGGKEFLAPLESALKDLAETGTGGSRRLVEWVVPSQPGRVEAVPHRLPYELDQPDDTVIERAIAKRRGDRQEWREVVMRASRPVVTRASKLGPGAPRPDLPLTAAGAGTGEPAGEVCPELTESPWYGRTRGIRVHAAMELVTGFGRDPDESCAMVNRPGDPPELVSEVYQLVAGGVEMLEQATSEGWRVMASEWPLLLGDACGLLPGIVDECVEVLTGTADLVLENGEGDILVVDFKTGHISGDGLEDRYRSQLNAYRTMLAAVTGREVGSEIWSLSDGERIQLSSS